MKPELLSKVGRYEFLAEPFHCDFPAIFLWDIWAIICSMQPIFIVMTVGME